MNLPGWRRRPDTDLHRSAGFRTIRTVLRKELVETLRDRRTLMIMVVLPVLLYPAIMVLTQQVSIIGANRIEAAPSTVAVVGRADPELLAYLAGLENLELVEVAEDRGIRAVRNGDADAVALIEPADSSTQADSQDALILFNAANDRSRRALQVLRRGMEAWGDTLADRRLAGRGLPSDFAEALFVADSSVALPADVGGYALGRFLPLLLIIITLLGTFYPAIDLAAGEKERGTLETLLTAPVPAGDIVTGKFLTVAVVGIVAAALNLGSMLLTFQSGLFQLSSVIDIDFSLPLRAIVIIFGTLAPLAVLFGALFLGVAVRARSFKEAQNALTPVYMIVMMPAFLPLFPGIELTPVLALVPVAGVALFFRDLMSNEPVAFLGLVSVLATVVYACGALIFAARSFGKEDVLFGADDTSERPPQGVFGSLVALFRPRDGDLRPTPSFWQGVFFVAVVALLYFYVGRALQLRYLLPGLVISQWGLMLLPAVLYAGRGAFSRRETLSLRLPPRGAWLGALLLILGGFPIGMYLMWLQTFVIEIPWDMVQGLNDVLQTDGFPDYLVLIGVAALTPAICEEAVFRGVLFSGLRSRLGMVSTIVLSAAIFGAFHGSFETLFRVLPTAWLGVLFGYAVWHTRSLAVSGMMHFLNNAAIISILAVPALREAAIRPSLGLHLLVLPPALLALGLGFRILRASSRAPESGTRVVRDTGSPSTEAVLPAS